VTGGIRPALCPPSAEEAAQAEAEAKAAEEAAAAAKAANDAATAAKAAAEAEAAARAIKEGEEAAAKAAEEAAAAWVYDGGYHKTILKLISSRSKLNCHSTLSSFHVNVTI
jgi:flagellar biosynthesis/type III secretory pathway protein FliH